MNLFPGGRKSLIVALFLLGTCCGCNRPAGPIFENNRPELSWPPPPHPARIQYVGAIRTADDLKPPRRTGEILERIFGGRKPPEPLYGPRAATVTSDGNKVWVADPGGRCVHFFNLESRAYRKIEG